jgi:hypothetical protein
MVCRVLTSASKLQLGPCKWAHRDLLQLTAMVSWVAVAADKAASDGRRLVDGRQSIQVTLSGRGIPQLHVLLQCRNVGHLRMTCAE